MLSTIPFEARKAEEGEEEQDAMAVSVQERVNYLLKRQPAHFATGSTHIGDFGHKAVRGGRSSYVQLQDVQSLAAAKFSRCEEGVTHLDFCTGANKLVRTPKQAQLILQYWKKKCVLFTYGRRKPQHYFLSKQEAEYSYRKCTYFDTTGVQACKTGRGSRGNYSRCYEYRKRELQEQATLEEQDSQATLISQSQKNAADSLLGAILLAKGVPLAIHNIWLHVQLYNPYPDDDEAYDRIPDTYLLPKESMERTKGFEYLVGRHTNVKFRAFPNNAVDIYIACSNSPFPLDTEEDVDSLFCFAGGVDETLRSWLYDVSNVFIPPVMDWHIIRLELNRDVPITSDLYFRETCCGIKHLTIKSAAGVFRMYAKRLYGGKPYIRQEKILPKDAVGSCFTEATIYELMKYTDTDPHFTTLPIAASAASRNHNYEKELAGNG